MNIHLFWTSNVTIQLFNHNACLIEQDFNMNNIFVSNPRVIAVGYRSTRSHLVISNGLGKGGKSIISKQTSLVEDIAVIPTVSSNQFVEIEGNKLWSAPILIITNYSGL